MLRASRQGTRLFSSKAEFYHAPVPLGKNLAVAGALMVFVSGVYSYTVYQVQQVRIMFVYSTWFILIVCRTWNSAKILKKFLQMKKRHQKSNLF